MEQTLQPHLALDGVTQRFGKVLAVDDLSLTVNRGEVVCLVGASGCGKSTLLRIIAGLERPDSGRVSLAGREITGPGAFLEPERRGIGFMFQDYALFPHLSAADNIHFGLKDRPRAEARARAAAIVDQLGIGALTDRFPHMLSGGEQQRVALARALAPAPAMLLMDEPFSNLDRRLRDDLRGETLAVLRRLGTTVIMVTHDPEEALSSGDRVVLMRSGRIVQSGTGAEVYDRPADPYAAEFFGSVNRIPGVCRNGALITPLGRFAAPGVGEGQGAIAFIRPNGLTIAVSGEGIDATVLGSTLMGEIEETTLAVAAMPGAVTVRSTTRRALPRGAPVKLSLPQQPVPVF